MKKLLLLLPFALLLGACQANDALIVQNYKVIKPAEALYYCPVLKSFPRYQDLEDYQVAKLLVELHKNNLTCKSSLNAIHTFLDQASSRFK